MIRDYVLTGALVGMAADAVKLTVNYTAYLLNFTQVVFWQITATRFLDKKDLFKPIAYIIGGIADLTMTALLGVIFVYFVYYFGRRYLLIKGIGFGLAVWVGIFGTLLGSTVQQKLPQSPSGIMVTMVAHLSFGLALAVFTGRLNMATIHVYKKKGS
ncbi:MAG TPA: hypothetical protein VNT57_07290 [Desulfobacteria bacterium]|nr:hypothetical protein [Desulfobacteria bacterium]